MKATLLLIASGLLLSSCTGFEVKTAGENQEHPCYSTWNHYPGNT